MSVARAVALAVALVSLQGLISLPPRGPELARLPGAEPFPRALQARLRAARDDRAPPSSLRTRHRRADGEPRYTNRLALESSPYLRQHAHNPVDWYPWGAEAFARARAERKPVLLSIGYSTCHWCHVMEEESFEDEEIAGVLNRNYVAIKVDREERPDLDDTYMTAVLLLTGNGGWPMTVWLTPERRPFYAGTYFPPRAGERGMPVGFLELLHELAAAYARAPAQIAGHAKEVAGRVARLATPAGGDALPDASVLAAGFAQYAERFDPEYGGFGRAAKFPMPGALGFLLRHHHRSGEPRALAMVTATLERMANGGIYDQVGGGFHRYATDRAWQVPHFEKMLSDNAELAAVYLDAFQATGRTDFARVARETLDYVARDMSAAAGGFYTASDADSGGGEGRFFVWTPVEIAAVLAPPEARAAIAYYGVTEAGNFAAANVLHVVQPASELASTLGQTRAELEQLLAAAREGLRRARARRLAPPTDTKIVTAWNGLMISAFARGGAILDEPRFVERARAAASFVLGELRPGGHLQRTWAEGAPHQDAFLEDYAFMIAGLLDLYDATFEPRWLGEALALHATMVERFWDPERGGYFLTAAGHEAAIVRTKPLDEAALPSGNAVAAASALRLAELTGDDRLRRRAADTVRAFAPDLERSPTRAPGLLSALDGLLARTREIAIVEPAAVEGRDPRLLLAVRRTYVPNRVLTVAVEGAELARQQALIPWLADKRALGGRTTAYVCERGVCALPTSDPDVLTRQLAPSRGPASLASDAATPRHTPGSD